MNTLQFNGMNLDFSGYRLTTEGPESPVKLIFSDTSEDTQTGSLTNTYNVNLGTYSYILFKITQKLDSTNFGACDMWIEFNGKTGTWPAHAADIWRFRSHFNWRLYQPIRCCQLYTNTDPVDWCDNLQSNVTRKSPQDGETCYYYNQSTPSSTTYAVHSLLINNSTGIAKHYIDGNYTCNGNLVTGGVFTAISKALEQSINYFYKDIYIYGSESEADLLQYINNN